MKPGIPFVLLFLILFQGKAFTQVISFAAGVDKQRIVIGEPIRLKLEAVLPVSGNIPWIELDTIPHFEILNSSTVDSSVSFNGLKLEQVLTITSWDSGSWYIPALRFINYQTKPISIEVGYSPMDFEQPYHDIKDIMDVPKPEKPEWFWYILLLALLLILFILFFPKSKNKAMEKKRPAEDPYKKAMKELSALDPQAENKVFFTQLVNTFREYLLNRTNIQSYSKTTDDLAIRLKQAEMQGDGFTELVQVLRLSDLVKFARMNPAQGDKERSIRIVKENIDRIEHRK